jgi:5-methylcytosine-specific restriction endonuclease McrA
LSRRNILERDGHTCQYCGHFGDTIDHVHPRSRGGGNSWANCVCACAPCNRKKKNMTPREAGMKLLSQPRRPSGIPWLRDRKVKARKDWGRYLFMGAEGG